MSKKRKVIKQQKSGQVGGGRLRIGDFSHNPLMQVRSSYIEISGVV